MMPSGWTVPEIEATLLRNGRYAVRPNGQLGTCGFYPRAWNVIFCTARQLKRHFPGIKVNP